MSTEKDVRAVPAVTGEGPSAGNRAGAPTGPVPVVTADGWDRPLPDPDPVSSPYWAAAARGQLLIQRCPSCGRRQFYPRALCRTCGAEPEWEPVSGEGTVHTFTVVRQYGIPPFKQEVPYVVAMVDLAEGPRMLTNLVQCDPEQVAVGMAVEPVVVVAGPEVGIPYWRPADPALRTEAPLPGSHPIAAPPDDAPTSSSAPTAAERGRAR